MIETVKDLKKIFSFLNLFPANHNHNIESKCPFCLQPHKKKINIYDKREKEKYVGIKIVSFSSKNKKKFSIASLATKNTEEKKKMKMNE